MEKVFHTILLQKSDGIANVILNRPEKHNAFNPEMITELTTVFEILGAQEGTRLVILSGNGPSFSAGADLNYMKEIAAFGYEENLRDAQSLAKLFQTVKNCPKPVVAVLHGAVYGGANGLAAACDIVLAHEETFFAFSEVNLGITPATIAPFVIARCGEAAARELMLTGRKFSAQEAYRFLLVNQMFSDERKEECVTGIVNQLLSSAPQALEACKTLIRTVVHLQGHKDELTKFTTKQIADRRASEEGQEGLAAFFAKRKPNWML
jgi:methylglutaconyl-CoA hydratase